MTPSSPRPIGDAEDLLEVFREAEKPRGRWRVGTESEKPGVLLPHGAPLPFEGPRSVRRVLELLAARFGWFEEREVEGGEVIALRRRQASITLEPGGQVELSGAPLATIHETAEELAQHARELVAIGDELGIAWLGLGFHPFAKREDLPWVPKLRYEVMRDYLPTRGSMALDMMLRTSTVQANVDFADEADAMRKLRVALRLQPIVTALFANSPFVEGRSTGERSRRARVWLHMDPDRSGLLPFLWDERDARYRDYVEWALDAPMFVVKRGKEVHRATHLRFRDFLRDGIGDLRATTADWETHLNTLFPEARLKRTLEVRGADGQAPSLLPALPALWRGLLYDDRALAGAEALAAKLDYESVERARTDIADRGLRAKLQDRAVADWAGDVVAIAESGLERLGALDAKGRDERMYLRPLRELVERGETPADRLLAELGEAPTAEAVIEATRLR